MDNEINSIHKIYRGAFDYFRKGVIYSEETFEVFKDKKHYTYRFISEQHTRTSTGELLRITTDYLINKSWIPQSVSIRKRLGGQEVTELFEYDPNSSSVIYTFTPSKGRPTQNKIPSPPHYHICTPTTVTSFLFVLSKKFDTTSRNDYTVLLAKNQWKYIEVPKFFNISLERVNVTSETISIGGHDLQCFQYKLLATDDVIASQRKKNAGGAVDFIRIFLSQHLSIPYLIEGENETTVQVKYLKNLEDAE